MHYTNQQGECPNCQAHNLKYEHPTFTDGGVIFGYTCEECHQVGEEFYSMNFEGHSIYNENDERIEL